MGEIAVFKRKRPADAKSPRGARLGFNLVLARGTLLFETLLRCLWRAVLVVGLFVAVALFDLLPALPGWLHGLLLVAAALALLLALWRGFAEFRWPGAVEAGRRIEQDAGVAHRPLTANPETPSRTAATPLPFGANTPPVTTRGSP